MKFARQTGAEQKFIGYRCPKWRYAQCKSTNQNGAKWKYVDYKHHKWNSARQDRTKQKSAFQGGAKSKRVSQERGK